MLNHEENHLIINILQNFLGQPRIFSNSDTRIQWEFNCPSPKCKHDHDKFNLAYKANDRVFKCWKCKYSGFVYKLVKEHGSKDDFKRLKLVLPEYSNMNFNVFKKPEVDYDTITCELPDGYMPLAQERKSKLYKLAWDYATKDRKLSLAQIDKIGRAHV